MSSATTTPPATYTGVITRIFDFKYGFLSSDDHTNLFFHFSELTDDAKAFIETGTTVTFATAPNGSDKLKAVGLQVTSAPGDNKFKNLEGEVQNGMQARGFCFIKSGEEIYLFRSDYLVNDDSSKEAGNTVAEGHKVIFDASYNHTYSPPKPFALNVRIVPGQTELNAASAALEELPMGTARSSATWQRGSRLGMEADESRDSLSPPRKLNRNSSIQDRASAFKAQGPVRRWSRYGEGGGEASKSSNAGGIDMKNNAFTAT